MFCIKCGQELPSQSVACWKCGNQVIQQVEVVPKKQPIQKENNSVRSIWYLLGRTALLLIVFFGVFGVTSVIWYYFETERARQNQMTSRMPSEYQPSTPTPIQPRQEPIKPPLPPPKPKIDKKIFTVEPLHYKYAQITLNTTTRIKGRITAEGGNNDIETVILSADEFQNYKNHNSYRSFYKSNYVTVGNFDLTLDSGSYYIIFNNTAALLTNKIVTVEIEGIRLD